MSSLAIPQRTATAGDVVKRDIYSGYQHAGFRREHITFCGIRNLVFFVLSIDPDSPGAIAIVDIACKKCRQHLRNHLVK